MQGCPAYQRRTFHIHPTTPGEGTNLSWTRSSQQMVRNWANVIPICPEQYLLEGTPMLVIIPNPKTANCQNIAAVTATTIFIKPQENEPSETLNKQSMPIMATQSFDSFAFLKCETFFALHYFAWGSAQLNRFANILHLYLYTDKRNKMYLIKDYSWQREGASSSGASQKAKMYLPCKFYTCTHSSA